MTQNKELLERIAELNEKRTQGDWFLRPAYSTYQVLNLNVMVCDTNPNEFDGIASLREIDAKFISLAPQMAELCLEQAKEIERLREASEIAERKLGSVPSKIEDWGANHYGRVRGAYLIIKKALSDGKEG